MNNQWLDKNILMSLYSVTTKRVFGEGPIFISGFDMKTLIEYKCIGYDKKT